MLHLQLKFSNKKFKIGTRNSPLALAQTNKIVDLLKSKFEDLKCEILTPELINAKLMSRGLPDIEDLSYNRLAKIALNLTDLDIIVHSMKDVSRNLAPEYTIGCICLRDSCEDVVVMRGDIKEKTLEELPVGSIIGTSSLRRIARLKQKYPQHELIPIKGDLDKRIYKLDNPDSLTKGEKPYSAIILAKAGMLRLNLQHRISQELKFEDSFYAVGQGALACECRSNDVETRELLSHINDEHSTLSCIAERSLLLALNCRASEAVAVQTSFSENELTLKARVSSNDGSIMIEKEETAQLPLDMENYYANVLSDEESFSGIAIWGAGTILRSKMLASKILGEKVAVILKLSDVDSILEANQKEKKGSRHKK